MKRGNMNESEKQPEPFLIELLIRSYSWFVQELNTTLETSGDDRLTRAQIITLFYLEDGKDHVQTLGTRMGLSRQAVSLTVRELEKEGILTMVTDPAKKSAKLITMTKQGRIAVQRAFKVLNQLEAKIARKHGKKNLADVKRFLQANLG